ncbi:glycoside hydrolase family 2 protein [Mucilaginibacter terrenus]|uniref:glycoside hydrolase family 2 protein n=1 Tax=Mucilaginibacter terrenus TaxID=2482727 RepID=UPI001F47B89F|nr:glycoside hydrolase family 2 TIM barrel-domain containing protein [Mucilaginibacter terrenus]
MSNSAQAQSGYELNSGWKCAPVKEVSADGTRLSTAAINTANWMPATVPGTVLTTLLNNKKVPDPFYGMNNEYIPDIYKTGADYYTYWFVKEFKETAAAGNQVYLDFRGVNYSCDIFLNGHKLNKGVQKGMFLRFSFNITPYLSKSGNNKLAVLVHPPDVVGNANGGQGGDGTIARNVGLQYTAGWDWIQPVRDRNTGIWDKVTIHKTGAIRINDTHVITNVPGIRQPEGPQKPATIRLETELSNPTSAIVSGTLSYEIDGTVVSRSVALKPNSTATIKLPDYTLQNPKLWWPNGYGPQNLYNVKVRFTPAGKAPSDQQTIKVGVREIQTSWNDHTGSREVAVNGQRVFIKGGNWVISDAMLRLSDLRYDAEVRFHRDMNLNLIRVWGGAMIERPEFYDACDRYGILVFQDLWGSGDCNGRWIDPMKKDDQWTRRKYPDDHGLFLRSAEDQIKMVRNHASLAIWCGGNEITPPEDILVALKEDILPRLDNTRWFVDYSNSEEMSRNTLGGNGDGPYGIQPLSVFWEFKTYPFNSEVGSVGINDDESLKRFIPAKNMIAPEYDESSRKSKTDSVWDYHKYIGYDTSINKYGKVKSAADFAKKAQLVNYDQYRGLAEGFTSHMWDWYTGFIIWKTQNPWTAMRGQMYDYYLDPNACLYGLHNGSEPLHVMYNPVNGMISLANNGYKPMRNMMLVVKAYDMAGKEKLITQVFCDIVPASTKRVLSVKNAMDQMAAKEGAFLSLQLLDTDKKVLSENLYWMADKNGDYSGLQKMKEDELTATARYVKPCQVEVTLHNKQNAVISFFNRISLVDAGTKERVLPAFYNNNYISVLPGEEKKIIIDYPNKGKNKLAVTVDGWNTAGNNPHLINIAN